MVYPSQTMPLSGPDWVARFPSSDKVDDLSEPFRANIRLFLAALKAAHAKVVISATFRPPERAYLMHHSFRIARKGDDPAKIKALPGVDIQWVHETPLGAPDPVASKAAAEQMVQAYDVAFQPAFPSRHSDGEAIDMDIKWLKTLIIQTSDGSTTSIVSSPKNGAGNTELHKVGLSYGVKKFVRDKPHWSSDGT